MKNKIVIIGFMTSMMLMKVLVSCQSIKSSESAGGAAKAVVSHKPGNTAVDAIMDAAVGGSGGSLIERQMDDLAKDLRENLRDAKIERLSEGLLITLNSRFLFEHDSFELQQTSIIKNLAKTLNKYDYTNVLIEGHTDSTGEDLYNQTLSDQRAREVENYLMRQGVKDARIVTKGYGESQPLASNDTEAGKQFNRRLEIAVYANEDMKYLARKGELGQYIASLTRTSKR